MVAALDALRELDLLRGREQLDPADVLQEQLERVRRRPRARAATGLLVFGLRLRRRPRSAAPRAPGRSSSSCPASRSRSSKARAISSAVSDPLSRPTRSAPAPRRCREHPRRASALLEPGSNPLPRCLTSLPARAGSVAVGSDSRHRPNGSSFSHLVLTFSRRLRRVRASVANVDFGSSATANRSSRRA